MKHSTGTNLGVEICCRHSGTERATSSRLSEPTFSQDAPLAVTENGSTKEMWTNASRWIRTARLNRQNNKKKSSVKWGHGRANFQTIVTVKGKRTHWHLKAGAEKGAINCTSHQTWMHWIFPTKHRHTADRVKANGRWRYRKPPLKTWCFCFLLS